MGRKTAFLLVIPVIASILFIMWVMADFWG
jgi:hypothetical protein